MANISPVATSAANTDRKRVKVYELKNNDWYDRGTGFCTGQYVNSPGATRENPDARIIVVSEDDEDGISPLLALDEDCVTTEELKRLHRVIRERDNRIIIVRGIGDADGGGC